MSPEAYDGFGILSTKEFLEGFEKDFFIIYSDVI